MTDNKLKAYQLWKMACMKSLKLYRNMYGMTQQELADKIGTSQTVICRWERDAEKGKVRIRHNRFKQLCSLFSWHFDYTDEDEGE